MVSKTELTVSVDCLASPRAPPDLGANKEIHTVRTNLMSQFFVLRTYGGDSVTCVGDPLICHSAAKKYMRENLTFFLKRGYTNLASIGYGRLSPHNLGRKLVPRCPAADQLQHYPLVTTSMNA